KGSGYYSAFILKNLKRLIVHMSEVEQFSRTKGYLSVLSEIDQLMMQALHNMDKAMHITSCVIENKEIKKVSELIEKRVRERTSMIEDAKQKAEENPKNKSNKSGKKRKKQAKGETYKKTYALLKEGKDAKEIAKIRDLTESTILGHIAKGIGAGEFSIEKFLTADAVIEISEAFKANKSGNIGGVYSLLDGKYNYGELRMVQNHLFSKEQV
ncbi:MAG: helix-turn-helix domain-containing protein, partial [Bacteroidia bacterium]|nr:helix-turn-helix domain-containing protein [Bacteroidia bacterium]